MFNANDPTQAAQAATVLNWLLATDGAGNQHALLRRFGVMYVIWNRRIFSASNPAAGWQPYNGASPHTDHIHFSFAWSGALKTTSWWRARRAGPLLAYDNGNHTMRLLRWSSTGTAFTGPATYTSGPFGLENVDDRIASGDVDGDGDDDVVMAYQQSDGRFVFQVFRDGLVNAGAWYTSGPFYLGPVGSRLTVGDYNGDGKAEPALVYDNGDHTMRIFRWTSTGTAFTGPTTYTSGPFGLENVGDRIASGDVNGDGKDDIVMTYQLSDGRMAFQVFRDGLVYGGAWYTSGAFYLGPVGKRMTLGDYNGDGKAEPALVYDNGDHTMRILRWTSTGTAFTGPATYTSGPFGLENVKNRIASGDADGNGSDDIVMTYQLSDGRMAFHVFRDGLVYGGVWYTSGPFFLGPVPDRLVMGDW